MADYHLHVKNISRSKPDGGKRSAVATAAYRAGQRLRNDYENSFSDFSNKSDVAHSEIVAPEAAPSWVTQREALWNAVDASERRKDSRLAKEVEFSLPREITLKDGVEIARALANEITKLGCVVDIAVHSDGHQS